MTRLMQTITRCLLATLIIIFSNASAADPIKSTKPTEASLDNDNKKIISATWMTSDFSSEITTSSNGGVVGILIKTVGYAPGESLSVRIADQETNDDGGSYSIVRELTGVVDKNGEARTIYKP